MMKKLFTPAVTLIFILGMVLSAHATLTTITFDEPGISIGDMITDQYAVHGIHWDGSYTNMIRVGPDFDNPFESDDQILWYNADDPTGIIQLDTPADYLSFEFRRPSSPHDIYLALYDTNTGTDVLVHNFGVIGWTGDPFDWWTFTYDGDYGAFDKIDMHCTNKFVVDNFKFGTVPIPPSVLLLGTSLIPFMFRRKKS